MGWLRNRSWQVSSHPSGLPSLTDEQRNLPEGEITLLEVEQVIGSLGIGKSPGNDGFPSDFYKTFVDILAPRLLAT